MNEERKSVLSNSDFLEENRPADYRPYEGSEIFDSLSATLKEINRIAIEESLGDEKAIQQIAKIIEDIKNKKITPEEGLKKAQIVANGAGN